MVAVSDRVKEKRLTLSSYGITAGPVEFTSRYMPGDVLSIYRTLLILDAVAGRSFGRYMHSVLSRHSDPETAVRQLAVALHFLTYAALGRVKTDTVQSRIRKLPTELRPQIKALKRAPARFFEEYGTDFKSFGKKRLWCPIRDYLKSPEYNRYFVRALESIDLREAKRWKRGKRTQRKALSVIELPGDIWNNNRVFRDGLFTPHIDAKAISKTWDMARIVRAIHDSMPAGKTGFYPEQLDVSFSFVPRMCAARNCGICLFGGGIAKLCHRKRGIHCPVALAACGYIHPCEPATCRFKQDKLRGACRSAENV